MDKPPLLMRVDREKENSHPRHIYPPLDLKYIQSALQTLYGETIPFMDGWLVKDNVTEIIRNALTIQPEIVVIKASTPCIEEAVSIGTKLRKAGIITIAVGQQVSHISNNHCDEWFAAFSFSVPGEPESEVPVLIQKIRTGTSVSDLMAVYRKNFEKKERFLVENPDLLPTPVFTPKEMEQYAFPVPLPHVQFKRWGYVMSSWGCPHSCQHCSEVIRKTRGQSVRSRSPEKVVNEIKQLLKNGAQAISFEDDSFLSNKKNFLGICKEIREQKLGFPWIAHARPDELDDEIVSSAKESGAVLFKVGVESGSGRIIESLGKSHSGGEWVTKVKKGFEILSHHKVGSVALFLVGSPEETLEDVQRSIQLASSLQADYIQVQIYTPYPDTTLYKKHYSGKQKDQILNEYHYEKPLWSPSHIAPQTLQSIQNEFYKKFYCTPSYLFRHLKKNWPFYLSAPIYSKNLASLCSWYVHSINRKFLLTQIPKGSR